MVKRTTLLLLAFTYMGLFYLLFLLYAEPIEISTGALPPFPENTIIKISGIPEDIRIYSTGINFKIGKVKIQTSSIKEIEDQEITVVGVVSEYNNETYIEAIKVLRVS